MGILSIQSQVSAGHVGNAASVFALQRRGTEVWPIPTALLSHHPGHGGAGGGALPAELLGRILDGMARHGSFRRCRAVLSGYLGDARLAAAVQRAVALARAGSAAIYLCDPVLGDDGRLYVSGEIVAAMHNLAAKADIVTPNAFELSLLTGQTCTARRDALSAMRSLQAAGPRVVAVSSFIGADTPPGTLDLLAADGGSAWLLNIPAHGRKFNGAGDLFAALFLDAWLRRRATAEALAAACAGVQEVLACTMRLGSDELALLQAQDLLAAPRLQFHPERIS